MNERYKKETYFFVNETLLLASTWWLLFNDVDVPSRAQSSAIIIIDLYFII